MCAYITTLYNILYIRSLISDIEGAAGGGGGGTTSGQETQNEQTDVVSQTDVSVQSGASSELDDANITLDSRNKR